LFHSSSCIVLPLLFFCVLVVLVAPAAAEVSDIMIYGEFQDVDGDGNRDFVATVIKIVPSEEIDPTKNEQYARNAEVYIDGELVGLTNETGIVIIYNVSEGDHDIKAVYEEGGNIYEDTWYIGSTRKTGASYLGYVIALAVIALVLAALIVWGIDKAMKSTEKKDAKKEKEWTKCRVCEARVKTKNLDVHMFKVHKKR